jgi:AP-1-like factor
MTMDSYPEGTQLWDSADFSQLPDNDFLALLQKHYPTADDGGLFMAPYPNAVNPQNLLSYPLPSLTPPSEESSPSPSNSNQENVNDDNNDSALKRKASEEDLSDGPTQKSQHMSGQLSDLEQIQLNIHYICSQPPTREAALVALAVNQLVVHLP